jgi:hypothetical protein
MRQSIIRTNDRNVRGVIRQVRHCAGTKVARMLACARTVFSWPVSTVQPVSAVAMRYLATLESRLYQRLATTGSFGLTQGPKLALVVEAVAMPVQHRLAHRLTRGS